MVQSVKGLKDDISKILYKFKLEQSIYSDIYLFIVLSLYIYMYMFIIYDYIRLHTNDLHKLKITYKYITYIMYINIFNLIYIIHKIYIIIYISL